MRPSLSMRSANLLFLGSMALVAILGSLIQTWNLPIGLILTETLFILLPAIVLLRFQHIPLRAGLSLNPIRPVTAILSLLLGISVFLFSILIEAIMMQLTGMAPVPVPQSSTPASFLDTVLYAAGLVLFAPLCEETLFRGVIQPAYLNRKSFRFAITITALMFAFYHFRLSGLPGLLPAAFILGYVAWRTHSIYASMLVHLGMNGTSAVNSLVAIYINGTGLPIVSIWVAAGGLLAAIVLIVVIRRLNPVPAVTPTEPAAVPETAPLRVSWIGVYWPLIIAGLLYLGVAGLSLVSALSPESRASSDYRFFKPYIAQETTSRYQILDRGGELVGAMQCQLTPSAASFHLDCSASVQAYEVKQSSSYFKDLAHTSTWSVTWDALTLDLLEYSFEIKYADGSGYQSRLENGQLATSSPERTDVVELPEKAWLEYEWPWRADVLQTNAGDMWKIPLGYTRRWDDSQKDSVPMVQNGILQVSNDQPLSLPAGQFTVRSFTFASQVAWYARDDPGFPRPVQFDDGMLTYRLTQ